ncbi:hypothetical protein GCM10009737_13500 [Nocardioides lentus]|uniref:Uncharacterized protein n=1 Tax=Nocardioides lentus TaxID=338077 RepID=A0ABN2P686_9ACTN
MDHSETPDAEPTVPEALAALDGLEDLPVGEHLAAFEQAHRELRSALQL